MPSFFDPPPAKLAVYLIAGVYTSPNFMEGLRHELISRLQAAGCRELRAELLFPYGDWECSLLRQLRNVRRDLRLPMHRRSRSLGARSILSALPSAAEGWRYLLIGHSGGGIAAVHAAGLLLEREPAAECRVLQVGSPKCAVPEALRRRTGYFAAYGRRGLDPVCRLGSWGGWARSPAGWPVYNRKLHAPGYHARLPLIGGHADYFRNHAPYVNGEGRTNLDLTCGAFWDFLER